MLYDKLMGMKLNINVVSPHFSRIKRMKTSLNCDRNPKHMYTYIQKGISVYICIPYSNVYKLKTEVALLKSILIKDKAKVFTIVIVYLMDTMNFAQYF